MLQTLLCYVALLGVHDESYLEWISEPAGIATLPEARERRFMRPDLAGIISGKPPLPFTDVTVNLRTNDGGIWLGSHRGLMYLAPSATRWRVFHSRRWLPADDIKGLAVTETGEVLVATTAGIAKLARRPMTLDQKIDEIESNLNKYHVREGLVGGIHLKEPGKLDQGYQQNSDDNDGLWTSMHVAAEAFRYAVTGDEKAKRNARRSLEAIMFLERVSGISGFAARSIVPITEPMPTHGEWHQSKDQKWWWKGDTSSDEVVGHYFAYSIYHDVAADGVEQKEIREYVERITDHILDNGLYYVGAKGVPTTWGVWAPEKLNHDLRRLGDRGLNSLEILSFLKVAQHIVGKPRYVEMERELIEKHAYPANTVFQKNAWPTDRINHSDDELAFLSYYPLLTHERDPELRKFYLMSIRRTWSVERPEHSPLFNFIFGAALQANVWPDPMKRPEVALVEPSDYDRDECIAWFRDVPADTIQWTISNAGRNDIGSLSSNRFNRITGSNILPVSERPFTKWNGDPYQLEGGSGGSYRDDGTVILLPYWMGRYHRLME